MSEYRLKISGVHYGANGDSTPGQQDTEEMHQRTRDLLSWLDRERPVVVLVPEPSNHFHSAAIMARAQGRRIGRVGYECVDQAWALLHQSGQPMLLAKVSEVTVKNHGYLMVTVEADDICSEVTAMPELDWQPWLTNLPLLPPTEQLMSEMEASYVLDNMYMPNLDQAPLSELKLYLDIWLKGSRHDLSREARQKSSAYIEKLEASEDKDIRQLAEELKQQRTSICGRTALDSHATEWWNERLQSSEVQQLWNQWVMKHDKKLWLGLRRIDMMLRQLPGDLYSDIGKLDVVLSRLYYMNTPRKAFQSILAMLMLRDLTCRELGIEMYPMSEDEYQIDGFVSNPMEIPTTIGRVVDFGKTRCDRMQQQTIERLVSWLRDDYEQCHCLEIEALSEPEVSAAEAIKTQTDVLKAVAERPSNEYKVYSQPGSTANLGCTMQDPNFNILQSADKQLPGHKKAVNE